MGAVVCMLTPFHLAYRAPSDGCWVRVRVSIANTKLMRGMHHGAAARVHVLVHYKMMHAAWIA